MAAHTYKLTAQLKLPDFEAARRYVLTEKEYVRRQLEQRRSRWWPGFSYPGLGVFRREDWQHYLRTLEHYDRQLDRHEQEIAEGLIPLTIRVDNTAARPDADVKIHLLVGNGSIHAKKKPPARPARMDGAPDKAGRPHWRWPAPGGFSRRHVRIGGRSVEVEFSKLGPHDSALLVNQVLYVSGRDGTELVFAVNSRNLKSEERGQVALED